MGSVIGFKKLAMLAVQFEVFFPPLQPVLFLLTQSVFGNSFRACLETHLSIMKRFNSMLAMAI